MIKGFVRFVIIAGLLVAAIFLLKAIFGADVPVAL